MPLRLRRNKEAPGAARTKGGAGGRKAKEAGIAVAIIGAVAVICAAALTSGAYAKICPARVCSDRQDDSTPAGSGRPASPAPSAGAGDDGPTDGAPSASGGLGLGAPDLGSTPRIGPKGASGDSEHRNGGTIGDPRRSPTAATRSTSPAKPIGDFSVSLLEDYGCTLRAGQNGYWDLNIWYTVGWVSVQNHPMPAGHLRVVTDLQRTKDWSLSTVGQPGNYLDTFVDRDDRYLGRFLAVRATVQPDGDVPETSASNNSIDLSVDLRGGLPPSGTNLRVPCGRA